LARDATPVIVLLDFPRQDRVKQARIAGAVTVLGKPWLNADLLATLGTVTEKHLAYAA
jgi:AmiR/NasT family two-component response regulator